MAKQSKTVNKPASNRLSQVKSKPSEVSHGLFITLEGGEGAGKSSQMTMLRQRLSELGYSVVTSREPGGSPGAEAVRHVLLSGAAESFGPEMEAILFSASRADHVDTVIRPGLDAGKIVISDRFFDSTRVYQGVSGKVDPEFVRRLEVIACGDTWPDLTLIIDLDPEEGMRRAFARRNSGDAPDRFEKESIKLQKMRRAAYLKIAHEEPERCKVIDGTGSPEQVFERIWTVLEPRLKGLEAKPDPAPVKLAEERRPLSQKKLTVKRQAREKAADLS